MTSIIFFQTELLNNGRTCISVKKKSDNLNKADGALALALSPVLKQPGKSMLREFSIIHILLRLLTQGQYHLQQSLV